MRLPVVTPLALLASVALPSARALADDDPRSFGMVALVRAAAEETPPNAWWLREDLGPAPAGSKWAGVFAPTIHDATGAPGLHLSSTGRGSRRRATALAAKGVATVGEGSASIDLDAFDRIGRGVSGEHVVRAPPKADRHTPPDVIQSIVRANFGRMKVCYDGGLRSDPRLAGRVVVKFVINSRGAVALSTDAGSDLPDPDVVACVVRAVDTLAFPESSDSAVTVVYPFVFSREPEP